MEKSLREQVIEIQNDATKDTGKIGLYLLAPGTVLTWSSVFFADSVAPGKKLTELADEGELFQNPLEWGGIEFVEAGIYAGAALLASALALATWAGAKGAYRIAMLPDNRE